LKLNLIIAGIGGQGINSLARVLAEFIIESGYFCQFTVHKGGAQSLGSVYAEIRISDQKHSILGQGIPKGELDLLMALEPWEGLRHIALSHGNTQIWIETQVMPLFVERANEREINSPRKQLDALPLNIQWRAYQQIAQQQSGTQKMANYYIGLDCISELVSLLDISTNKKNSELFDQLFFSLIKKAKQ